MPPEDKGGNFKITKINNIQSRIYTIRGKQVMLDNDLAELYGVKPIRLREQVKRNKKRFPVDFIFKLSKEEAEYMVSQNAIPSKKHLGGYLPYVFTEQGVAMLASVLHTDSAVKMSIIIMRAFVEMRKFILNNVDIFAELKNVKYKLLEHDKKFEEVFKALENKETLPKQGIFFNGQVFDAYKFVSGLIRSAKKSIILIDNYIDETVLTLLIKRKKNVKVIIYTKKITKQLELDLKKFNTQYPSIEIKEFKKSYDRFLIIDDVKVYHFGASLKDLGKKWFAFSQLEISSIKILDYLKDK
jgi:hypothetical protein